MEKTKKIFYIMWTMHEDTWYLDANLLPII